MKHPSNIIIYSVLIILSLCISCNQSKEITVGKYKRYKNLEKAIKNPESVLYLDLSNQELDHVPQEVWSLINLEKINLSHNNLRTFPIDFCKLSKLKMINLNHNKIDSIDGCITKLQSLEILWLKANLLSSVPYEMTTLKNLKFLYLVENNINSDHLEQLMSNMPEECKVIYHY
nr:leucine-rich repeat domain-containing protein [Bacteroidota bacterium]